MGQWWVNAWAALGLSSLSHLFPLPVDDSEGVRTAGWQLKGMKGQGSCRWESTAPSCSQATFLGRPLLKGLSPDASHACTVTA